MEVREIRQYLIFRSVCGLERIRAAQSVTSILHNVTENTESLRISF